MQNPAAIHHYIPIFWTRQWADDGDGQVVRFTKPYHKVIDRRVAPERCFSEKNLYALPGGGPAKQILEEHFFKQLDDLASRALRKMNRFPMEKLSPEETLGWSNFIVSLFHRAPEHLEATKAAGSRIWRNPKPSFEKQYQDMRSPTDPTEYSEYIARRSDHAIETDVLRNLPYLIMNKNISEHLVKCHWVKFPVPDNEIELVLSDDPLLRTNGIMVPGGHFAMPLSPRQLLIIAPERSTIKNIDRVPIKHLVKEMNSWSVQSARKIVVASNLDQMKFISKHFGTVPRPPMYQN